MLKHIAIAALLTASAAQAANFFPLSPGSRWTYRSDSGETFEITVGFTPIVTNGKVYHKVTGYASQPLHVRRGDDGVIYWLNEEFSREEILTDFRPVSGAFYNTPISAPCDQDAQAQERPVEFEGAGGVFPDAREIQYRVLDCADVGVLNELYLDNIGLARRTNQTIAGPREFKLVSAKIGSMTISEAPGAEFRVSLSTAVIHRETRDEPVTFDVSLRLVIDRLEAVRLRYPTSQRYDIAVKNERGETVYLWSSTAIFLPAIGEEEVLSREYSQTLSLNLPDGRYEVEAWLTTEGPDRRFSGVAPFSVFTDGPIPATQKQNRTRARR